MIFKLNFIPFYTEVVCISLEVVKSLIKPFKDIKTFKIEQNTKHMLKGWQDGIYDSFYMVTYWLEGVA